MTAPTPSPEIPADIRALIEAERASLTAPLRAEVEDAKGALEDAAAHEDNDTASVADRIATLAEERDFFRSAWFAVLDALYPHRLPDDQFDPKEVAQEVDAIATETESLRAEMERRTRRADRAEKAEAEVARLRVALSNICRIASSGEDTLSALLNTIYGAAARALAEGGK